MNEADMSVLTSLNMTTDASRSKLPTNTTAASSTILSNLVHPQSIKSTDIVTAPQVLTIKPSNPPLPTRSPPLSQPIDKNKDQEQNKLDAVNKLANARNQLFNDDVNNDSQNESTSKAGRSKPRSNITMSFDKKTGGNIKIYHPNTDPSQRPPITIIPPTDHSQRSPLPINPQIVSKANTSPEVSAFNPLKPDSDKFKTVESSRTEKLAIDDSSNHTEVAQLKARILSVQNECDDRLEEAAAKIKQRDAVVSQMQVDFAKLNSEKKDLLIFKRDYLIAKDEISSLKSALENKPQTSGAHPDTVRLAQVTAAVSQMHLSIDRLENEKLELNDRIQKLAKDNSDLQQRVLAMASRESQMAEDIARDRTALNLREKEWREEKEVLTSKAEEKHRKADRLVRETENIKIDFEARLDALSAENARINQRILAVDDENSDLKERLRNMEDEMEQKVHLNAAVQERQKTEKQLTSENNHLKQQVNDLNAAMSDLLNQSKAFKEATSATAQLHKGELESKDAVVKRLEAELGQAVELANHREQELANLEEHSGSELKRDREKVALDH